MSDSQHTQTESMLNRRITQVAWITVGLVAVYVAVMAIPSGKSNTTQTKDSQTSTNVETTMLYEQINPKDGYNLSVSYRDLGPRLLASGVINYDAFAAIYQNAGSPLSAEQVEILKNGSDEDIIINSQNAYYLLNFFWAVGLANRNVILTEGPMVQNSDGKVENFASTGGWSLATKPITDLYASLDLIALTEEQQKLVEEVAQDVYRPCCDNPTHFPDCNHGMAMLGILELMASQGATADQMFEAAKYINAYWFPQQTLETALYLKANEDVDFADANPRLVVGKSMSSASGAKMVHADLQSKGLLQQAPGQGGSCAN
ncbi:MAG: hypothetical protein ABI621_14445 [Chloroflexota bacterium]